MSQKRVKKWFAGLFLAIALIAAGTILLFLLKPELFIRDLEKHAGSFFPSGSEITVSINSFSGNFFSGFKITGIELNHNQKLIGYIGEIETLPRLSSLFIEQIVLKFLALKNIRVNVDAWSELELAGKNQQDPAGWPVSVRSLTVENLNLNIKGDVFNILARGDMNIENGIHLRLTNAVIKSDQLKKEVLLAETDINLVKGITTVTGAEFSTFLDDNPVSGSASLRITPSTEDGTYVEIQGNCLISETLIDEINVAAVVSQDRVTVERSNILYNGGLIQSQGWFYRDFQSWEISAELEAFKYANSSINFSTKGTMDLRGFNGIDSTSADFALADVDINSFLLESLDGSVNFTDGLVKNNSMVDFRAQNYSGSITELSAESITNLSIACKVFADEWIVSRLIKELPGVRITGEGEFDYTRNEGNHDFQGIFTADSLNYGTLSSGKTTCDVQYGKKTGEAAEANINGLMTDLTLGEKKFDQSLFIITAGQGKIYCEKLEGHNVAGEFISITGEISDSLRSFDVSSFKGMLNTLPFEFDPFRMYEKDKKYLLDQTAVYIGDGRIKLSGEFGGRTDYRLQSSLENINLRLMNDFFNFSQRFQGTANGDLQLSNFTNSPILFSDLVITDGFFDEIKFQHINGKFTYRNQRLMFSDVFMDAETGKASLAGLVTLGKDGSGDFKLTERDSLAIDIKLEKFSLSAINRYVPWSLHTDGQVIGDINISGSPASPKIVGDFVITDPVIDKITGETLTGRIVYENKRAYFKGAQLITDSGSYTGSGFIPVNLNILTENRRDFLDDPMDLMLTGTSGQFEFLTPYIELLDSLSGDFSLQLSISGTYKNPIRNGQLIVKNGMMSVLPVTNTLYEINGFATIDNNQFMIKNMSGITRVEERDDDLWGSIKKFYRSLVGSGKTDLKESRFTVSGGMDLTQFFKPEFDISFKGDDLFFASSENIFKGIASLDLMITGRDTILVSGEIVPSPYEFFITDEFDFDYNPEVSRKANVALIAYDIHVPLDNVVIVKNSFIPEMELDGDLNITSVGYGNTRFSGTVNVLSGSFILSGTEFTDAEGTLFLDPSNTVPSVDIEALTSISATEYRLFFTGDLNNPTIEIRDEDTGTFITPDQQNGILRLLIAREEGAGPGLDETGKSIFSNYLETEFEGFVSRYSPIDRFQVQSSKALLTDFNKADVNIYIGKNLTRKLYMDIRSDVFSDQVTNEYEVGYRINRNMSIVGRLDEYGLPHMNYRIKIKY